MNIMKKKTRTVISFKYYRTNVIIRFRFLKVNAIWCGFFRVEFVFTFKVTFELANSDDG